VRLEGVADPREVGGHGLWVDVMTHKDYEEREGVNGRTDGTVMELAKSKIRLEV